MSNSVKEGFDLPLVSIGLPVFNSEKTIADAIKTIIDQSIGNWELIISDNNSIDNTVEIVEQFVKLDKRIFLYKQIENIGMYSNFDFVLKKSRGEYFHWLAADDKRSIDFLSENISFLDRHSDFVASCSQKFFGSAKQDQKNNVNFSLEQTTAKERIDYLLKNIWQSHSIYYSVIRTQIIKKCQFLGEHFLGQDWIIDIFLAKYGKIALQNKSYIIIGKSGVSITNPYKPFRTSWIEFFIPLYTLHKRFNLLINSFSFIDKSALQLKIIFFHVYIIKMRLVAYIKGLIKKHLLIY